MPCNMYETLARTARMQPDHAAVLGPGADDRLSYGELIAAIDIRADSLREAGLKPGDCIGVHCPSGRDYIILNFAVWRCGGCVVPIPVELTDAEKQEVCREISLDALVFHEDGQTFAEPFRTKDASVRLPSGAAWSPVRSPCAHPAGFREINAAFIRFTSGTTGTSKGVVLSHETIFDRIHAANDALQIGPDDRIVWVLSMSYHFTVSIVGYLSLGATVLLPPSSLPQTLLDTARRHHGTILYASPVHYAWLADCADGRPLASLRLAISTAVALERHVADTFHRRFGIPISQALGLIEVGLPCINVQFAAEHGDSVGPVLPAYALRLSDAGLGPALKAISFSGKGFLDAYYQPWQTRSEIMPDGWFQTGDVGELGPDGCLFIRGRLNDVINVMGMKFFPAEVEARLKSHPRVREACVFAEHHPRCGEMPLARVVPEMPGTVSEEELLDYCREHLAAFKVPHSIELVETLRRTASGKILRSPSASPGLSGVNR